MKLAAELAVNWAACVMMVAFLICLKAESSKTHIGTETDRQENPATNKYIANNFRFFFSENRMFHLGASKRVALKHLRFDIIAT